MNLILAPNPLYPQEQNIHIDKVAMLIGENGCGKSSILHSIFEKQLIETDHSIRLICATSGQNENFSSYFEKKLTDLRSSKDIKDIDFSCLFFTSKDVRFLILLAFTFHKDGLVSNFIKNHDTLSENTSVNLEVTVSVPEMYVKRVASDLDIEATDPEYKSIRRRPFNQRLELFLENINNLPNLEDLVEKEMGLKSTKVSLNNEQLFEMFDGSKEDAVKFFIEGSYNEYFFSAFNMHLHLKDGIEFSLLSDGEYQLLFILALIDLFDHESALFIFDEVDSHLHHKNIELLWNTLTKIKGKILTTSHSADSITENEFESLYVVGKGRINNECKSQKILERLKFLSKSKVIELEIASKLSKICLVDHYNDWIIFEMLARKKGLDWDSYLAEINPIAKSSGYSSIADRFGSSKIRWVEDLKNMKDYIRACKAEQYGKAQVLHPNKITNIFLICDRDELPNANIDSRSGVKVTGVDYKEKFDIGMPCPEIINNFLLTWKRKEIKNYLISYTALMQHNLLSRINNDQIAKRNHLKPNDPSDNDDIRHINAKSIINPLINTDGVGLDRQKLQDYVDLIPPEEISEDIANMFEFIKENLT